MDFSAANRSHFIYNAHLEVVRLNFENTFRRDTSG